MDQHIIIKLYKVLQARKDADAGESYVASLYAKGSSKIADKIREEAEEVIVEALALDDAAGDGTLRDALASESADLLFHLLVMMAHHDVHPDAVFDILSQRFGISGHEEKASRG